MNTNKKNVLFIVDDDDYNRLSLVNIFQKDYTLYWADNGASAVAGIEKYMPDIILLDVLMPGMDGYEVFAKLQESENTKKIPVIFITGLTENEDERKGLVCGAVDYITKPFDDIIVKLRVQHQIKIVNLLRDVENLSMTDQLTRMPNRRSFDNRLCLEWSRAVRESVPLSLMFMDVDRFKNYNDTYGHQQGDLALEKIAGIMTKELKRSTDYAARWGGEEFAVLLSNTESDGALEVAESIRTKIENVQIPLPDGQPTTLTVSIGLSTQVPKSNSSIEDFIRDADDALYTAKNNGRNMAVQAGQTVQVGRRDF